MATNINVHLKLKRAFEKDLNLLKATIPTNEKVIKILSNSNNNVPIGEPISMPNGRIYVITQQKVGDTYLNILMQKNEGRYGRKGEWATTCVDSVTTKSEVLKIKDIASWLNSYYRW